MFNPLRVFKKETVRVRIAPSPTGFLHVGTARTALFNWLFARKYGGRFILRIEDTDLERSEKRFEKDILEGLKWLGLDWDEGPYYQSQRLNLYSEYLKKLINNKMAYYCACTIEELEKERQNQLKNKESPKYSGKCRGADIPADKGQIIRFRVPENEEVEFNDLVRGKIVFNTKTIGDIAIAKNLRAPLYNFAVVIDDYEMRISHVIRGEDHIANTPKQILLQKTLRLPQPKYAHLPLILDPDRSKMSKRHSATAIQEYKESGYLPEALVNFIALLGWHPAGGETHEGQPVDDKEKIPTNELIKKFSLDRIQKGGAIFDIQKLNWLNSEYLKEKTEEELWKLLKELYGEKEITFKDKISTLKLLRLERFRMEKLRDFLDLKENLSLKEYNADLLIWKDTALEKIRENLQAVNEIVKNISEQEFNQKQLEILLMPFADREGRGEVLWPLRVALSGRDKSPGPFELMDIIGKEETLKRIDTAIKRIKN